MLIPSGHRERGISPELSRVNKVHGACGALKNSARDLLLLLLGAAPFDFKGAAFALIFCFWFLLLRVLHPSLSRVPHLRILNLACVPPRLHLTFLPAPWREFATLCKRCNWPLLLQKNG
jgi:hypothetical protein